MASLRELLRAAPPLQSAASLALALGFVACLVIIGVELTGPAAHPEESAKASARVRPAATPDPGAAGYALPAVQSFSAVTERPLFAQSRRPSARADDSLGPWSSLVLSGIIISGDSREALITHGKPPVIVHLQEGQDIDGWTVTSIQPDRVVLRGASAEHELKLTDKPAPATPPGPINPRRPFEP